MTTPETAETKKNQNKIWTIRAFFGAAGIAALSLVGGFVGNTFSHQDVSKAKMEHDFLEGAKSDKARNEKLLTSFTSAVAENCRVEIIKFANNEPEYDDNNPKAYDRENQKQIKAIDDSKNCPPGSAAGLLDSTRTYSRAIRSYQADITKYQVAYDSAKNQADNKNELPIGVVAGAVVALLMEGAIAIGHINDLEKNRTQTEAELSAAKSTIAELNAAGSPAAK